MSANERCESLKSIICGSIVCDSLISLKNIQKCLIEMVLLFSDSFYPAENISENEQILHF